MCDETVHRHAFELFTVGRSGLGQNDRGVSNLKHSVETVELTVPHGQEQDRTFVAGIAA